MLSVDDQHRRVRVLALFDVGGGRHRVQLLHSSSGRNVDPSIFSTSANMPMVRIYLVLEEEQFGCTCSDTCVLPLSYLKVVQCL